MRLPSGLWQITLSPDRGDETGLHWLTTLTTGGHPAAQSKALHIQLPLHIGNTNNNNNNNMDIKVYTAVQNIRLMSVNAPHLCFFPPAFESVATESRSWLPGDLTQMSSKAAFSATIHRQNWHTTAGFL